ncbi:hypothetical protein [Arenivirga flava]|uniref:Uncharacterized protein n=1 Tax=Arenivirga flava TaxID=1930060 RepID=A0AA37UE94_9MICO|nr:hypothetical protein [Arenivirga flava]GMA28644.1 hypothetical protein GCM10025874_18970 [Arenivirga flava]
MVDDDRPGREPELRRLEGGRGGEGERVWAAAEGDVHGGDGAFIRFVVVVPAHDVLAGEQPLQRDPHGEPHLGDGGMQRRSDRVGHAGNGIGVQSPPRSPDPHSPAPNPIADCQPHRRLPTPSPIAKRRRSAPDPGRACRVQRRTQPGGVESPSFGKRGQREGRAREGRAGLVRHERVGGMSGSAT